MTIMCGRETFGYKIMKDITVKFYLTVLCTMTIDPFLKKISKLCK